MVSFDSWYTERHGYAPFPWQSALATRIAANDWPEALTPPTGSGKTSVIDVWLWASQQRLPMPKRLVYVIDRRLVVDGVVDYATDLAASLPEHERPAVITMRGGITIDNGWLMDPTRPTVIVSTVDQVGSRLLFSGYGVSPKAAAIHAGLLGNDALWVLDEVHLAQPLLQTLGTIATMRDNPLSLPWRVLPMSATWEGDNTHGLSAADHRHPVLARRLNRPKPAKLVKLKGDVDLAKALAEQALTLREGGAEVVAVVCNRVARARAVFERLSKDEDTVLLTGRIRPADKDSLLAEYLPRIEVHSRSRGRAPLFIVATQTIEVGADLDFDAMVTECAPLSALRQRAGRLNRLGELRSAPMTVVFQPAKTDKVYGNGPAMTWKWLSTAASGKPKTVDFGIAAMDALVADNPPPQEPTQNAPLLLRSHVEMLAQTSVPHGIDVTPWLHGWQGGAPDAYLCWRSDWSVESVEAAPPIQPELLPVPLWALRQWTDEVGDLESQSRDSDVGEGRSCIRWDGETATTITTAWARAGDTLVLDASVGGCDRYGWAPESVTPVCDVADSARRVRLHPAVHPELANKIEALLSDERTSVRDWRQLAEQAGLETAGRVVAYPGGCVVLSRDQWTSYAALKPIALQTHLRSVGDMAALLAAAFGLADPALVKMLRQAGAAHDIGKIDPRWQAMVGGDHVTLLAKGPGGDDPWRALPKGWRHEMGSVDRMPRAESLVRYLVGTHHGHGRPLLPAAPDIALWRRMGDWTQLYSDLTVHYGPWGLALLETVLRLADWVVSEAEQCDEMKEAA